MSFMNDYDVRYAAAIAEREGWRVMLGAVQVIERLMQWANENSDGWAHWPKPARAARSLIDLIEDQETKARSSCEVYDMTYADRDRALRPIKAFLTRHGVDPRVKAWIIDGIEIGAGR